MRVLSIGLALSLSLVGCGKSGGRNGNGGGGGNGAHDLGAGGGAPDLAPSVYNDFPPTPVIDPTGSTPAGAPGLFGSPTSGAQSGGPCLLDPEPGSLLPQNWMRPRFHFAPMTGQNLFEIRLHAANQANDLVVYTTQSTWTMDAATWQAVAAHVVDQPITVSVRGAVYDGSKLTAGPSLGTTGSMTVAPVSAPGAIIYWAASSGVTALRGFTIGEETVHDVLKPSQVSSNTQCVACHSSTPDGTYVGFSWTAVSDNGDPAQAALRSTDGMLTSPSFITPAAASLMQRVQELPIFSKAHWSGGDHVMVSVLATNPNYDLIWTDLEATSSSGWGSLQRSGDSGFPGAPAWSHDGQHVAYGSGSHVNSGYQMTDGDIRVIPYNNRMGGTSTAVAGASDPSFNEYFPTYSSDDQFLAYTRIPTGSNNYPETNTAAEVLIVPAGGGTATRLAANDPVACSGRSSPGLTNSWPKWAPDVSTAGTRKFYWLTFSSHRADGSTPQLFVTPVVVDGGVIKSFPALYLWNQPATEGNHTPAWDNFKVPIS